MKTVRESGLGSEGLEELVMGLIDFIGQCPCGIERSCQGIIRFKEYHRHTGSMKLFAPCTFAINLPTGRKFAGLVRELAPCRLEHRKLKSEVAPWQQVIAIATV
jgi:hypothetical protein